MRRLLAIGQANGAPGRRLEIVMTMLFRRPGTPLAGRTSAATLTLGLVVAGLLFCSPASAQTKPCSDDASAPTGPATVSVASTPSYGRVLVEGSGDYAGCSLYVLTSDQLHSLNFAEPFACSDKMNPLDTPCDSDLWPALLTNGAPIAGPGVNPRLLGTVTRTDIDMPALPAVQQVTYAGQPLYRFFLDKAAGDTQGANLDDPVTSTAGIWYLVHPRRGTQATGPAQLQLETAPLDGTGPDQTVLAARMNNDFSAFPDASFPVYTLSPHRAHGRGNESTCQGLCAIYWPPVLTSRRPEAGPGVDQHGLGVIGRPDGSHQVTYDGQPLYLFNSDAYIGSPVNVGTRGIYGAGTVTPWGEFNTLPPPL
jgi:predicted lipoprotein with Yx(FWY)xxD motif